MCTLKLSGNYQLMGIQGYLNLQILHIASMDCLHLGFVQELTELKKLTIVQTKFENLNLKRTKLLEAEIELGKSKVICP